MQDPTPTPTDELVATARRLRIDILEMLTRAGSGHPGGSLSALDLILTLYSGEMRFDPSAPQDPARDRFVLSKGHGVPALYAVMAERGYFDRAEFDTLREVNTRLQGHPANAILPGIEASTGSLGQGLSVAQGIAFAATLDGSKAAPAFRVYALLGDGELQEGQVWEAAMSAPHFGLHHLTAICDLNKGQIDGLVDDVMSLSPLADKWAAFGWHVVHCDGHDFDSIRDALSAAREEKQRPTVILADTIKGKGVSFMERDTLGWHGKTPTQEEFAKAKAELLAGGAS